MGKISNLIVAYQERHRTDRVPSISEMMQAEAEFHEWIERNGNGGITDEQLREMDEDNRRQS